MKRLLEHSKLILIFFGYAGLRLGQAFRIIPYASSFNDTKNYLKAAQIPLFSLKFFGSVRPFTIPLIFKIGALNPVWIAWIQVCISILCWGFLIYQATVFIKNQKLRMLGLIGLLLFTMTYYISGWDVQLMSESLALSFQALLLGMGFWLLREWAWYKVLLLGVVALLWACTRDTNPWILLGYGAGLFLVGVLKKSYRRWIFISLIFVLIFAYSQWSIDYSRRWSLTFAEVLPWRVLKLKKAVPFFESCGMPHQAGITNYYTWLKVDWLYSKGKYCFFRWVIANPEWSLTAPLLDWNVMLGFDPIAQYNYFPQEFPTILPRVVEQVLYPGNYGYLFWWFGGVVLGFILATPLRGRPAVILSAATFLMVFPTILLSWHVDVLEIGRHALQPQCAMFISLWLLVLFTLDYIIEKRMPHLPDFSIMEKEVVS